MRNDDTVAVSLRERNGLQRFRQCSGLIRFDQNRIGQTIRDAVLNPFCVGDKEIVTDQHGGTAETFRQGFPKRFIVFSGAVFDGENRIK